MTRTAFDPDELAMLEEERDFLLRSLDDLERERDEGNIEPHDYERLHDDYTARAASVIRSIRDGVEARARAPSSSPRRKLVVAGAVAAFAAVAALLLGGALGERLPGQTVTGNQQLAPAGDATDAESTPPADLEALATAVDQNPDDPAARIAYADALLQAGQAADALRQYDAAAALDPDDGRVRATAAFVVFQAGLVDEALARLDEAARVAPEHADTYFLRGIVLYRGAGDRQGAREAFERYLELAPRGAYASDVETIIEQIEAQSSRSEGE